MILKISFSKTFENDNDVDIRIINIAAMEVVKKYTLLMLSRRGYENVTYTDTDEEGNLGKKPRFHATKPDGEPVVVFFVSKKATNEKVTVQIIKSIISMAGSIKHRILVYDTVLTSDARNSTMYNFETFTFDELSYDLNAVLFLDENCPDNVKVVPTVQERNKLPILNVADPIARYFGIQKGEIVKGRFDGTSFISFRRCAAV
jgi:hypothetical protein